MDGAPPESDWSTHFGTGPLDEERRTLVLVFAAVVKDARTGDEALRVLSERDCDAEKVLEILLQVPLFAGFPRTINALYSFRRHFGDEVGAGPAQVTDGDELVDQRRRGDKLFRKIYAENTDRVLQDLDRFHPELKDWILTTAYGKILSRSAIDPDLRELAAVAALAVSGDDRQLSSHIRGAIHCGASAHEVRGALDLVRDLMHPASASRVDAILTRIFPSDISETD